ncbi:MAG: 50S ribosomal protein L9 [Clostridia bacterium]|nr:50S ribosomal protein L9 [Clostridia bacterium]
MKVILKADVKGQGKKDQVVNVSDGFARNYLFPKGLAVEANAANLNMVKQKASSDAHKLLENREKTREMREELKKASLKIAAKGGSNGKLFGSVTSKEISEALKEQYGMEIDRRMIALEEPLKQFGEYEVKVKLFEEVNAVMKVELIKAE